MSDLLTKYDAWLKDDGPAALVIREHLMPVEGNDGVVFPSTFAAEDGNAPDRFKGGYNIDTFGDGESVCLIDSVGSQANRVEPVFMRDAYKQLVPQIVIKAGDREVNILEAGHRAGDALVRCSSLKDEIERIFRSSTLGNAEPLAKLAPTSLVFGVWNSRGEKGNQDRRPRLIASSILAFNVRRLTRSAAYVAPIDYSLLAIFSEEDKEKAEGDSKNPLSKRGFVNALASGTHGGVIATGGIRRDATLILAAIRLLKAGGNDPTPLRRYILGLSLVAFTHPSAFVGYLRQGCTLVRDPDKVPEFVEVHPDGKRAPAGVTHDAAVAFALASAKAFGVGESKTVDFSKDAAKQDVTKSDSTDGGGKTKGGKGKKLAASNESES